MIEQTLERIAVALEKIANTKPEAKTETPMVAASAAPVAAPVEPTVLVCAGIKTTEELRAFVQKYLDKAGAKTSDLIAFIKEQVSKKFAPNDPKLVNIPLANVAEAAQMIYDWCGKNGIVVG